MRNLTLPLLALLTACAGQPSDSNPFNAQADFAAQRQKETILIEDMDRETACVHVTEVLMDLECVMSDINADLGIVSGNSSFRWVHSGEFLVSRRIWLACGGSSVTVSVRERDDDVAIRASFQPPKPEADQAFRTLLRSSIAQQREK